jgi:hypothetical protein
VVFQGSAGPLSAVIHSFLHNQVVMSSHLVVDNTLGAAFCGFAVSCMVFGIYLTQVYAYFDRYPLDRLAYKYLVIVLSLLETVDQCFIGYTVYYYAISNFDSPLVLIVGSVLWSLLLQLLLGAFVGAIVKLWVPLLLFSLVFFTFGYSDASPCACGGVRRFISPLCFRSHQLAVSNHNIPLTALLILLIFAQLGVFDKASFFSNLSKPWTASRSRHRYDY